LEFDFDLDLSFLAPNGDSSGGVSFLDDIFGEFSGFIQDLFSFNLNLPFPLPGVQFNLGEGSSGVDLPEFLSRFDTRWFDFASFFQQFFNLSFVFKEWNPLPSPDSTTNKAFNLRLFNLLSAAFPDRFTGWSFNTNGFPIKGGNLFD